MKKKVDTDVLEMLNDFQKSLRSNLTTKKMYQEIKMMKFKVRPIQGNLTEVNLNNQKFVKTLWSLGKLDEFFQKQYYRLSRKKKNLFVKIFDDIYSKYQQELNKINLQWEKNVHDRHILEVEIYKEIKNKRIN